MVFSSIAFIYYFLPIILLAYFILPQKFKNLVLLIGSLIFYFYGEQKYIVILLLSCFINYIFALLIEKKKQKKFLLTISITLNVAILYYFKYTNFTIININNLFKTSIPLLNVVMPIGVSFFTFQAISYLIDVYNNKVKANKSFLNFATYICLFPQLVAGPIVRYKDINDEINSRKVTFSDFAEGVKKFTIGLGKKILIANVIGEMCTILSDIPEKSSLAYILIGIGYSIQIYFDFSGYSDMAIGLGRMFGFHFTENFNYPFVANSITDFWRRWHISLSSWFRDYVYIPLGGNRTSTKKFLRNILIVWTLTGFWHGAAWNFIMWGLYFGILLILEKFFFKNFLQKHKIFSHIYTLIIVIISFIIFSIDDFNLIIIFLKNMFGFNHLPFMNNEVLYYLKSYFVILIIAIISATPLCKNISKKLKEKPYLHGLLDTLEVLYYIFLLIVSTAYLIDSSFNPFLYFRF